MDPIDGLQCELCFQTFFTDETWTKHLFTYEHQSSARPESDKWTQAQRECSLVARFHVHSCTDDKSGSDFLWIVHQYLNYIIRETAESEGETPTPLLIMDFVYWEDRPRFSILQFESQEMADLVFLENLKPRAWSRWAFSFRKLTVTPDEAWEVLRPAERNFSASSSSCSSFSSYSSNDSWDNFDRDLKQEKNVSPLATHFKEILQSVEVPELQAKYTRLVLTKLSTLIGHVYPDSELHPFRTNFPHIRNPFSDDLLIFIHGGDIPTTSANQGFIQLDLKLVSQIIMTSDPSLVPIYPEDDSDTEPLSRDSQKFELLSCSGEASGSVPFNFWVVTHHNYLVEITLSYLLEYILKFAPEGGHLLALFHHFCTVNSCYFNDPQDSPSKCEAMEWLVVLFLSMEKLIPTVRKVLSLPHQSLVIHHPQMDVDIGFNRNEDFEVKFEKNKRWIRRGMTRQQDDEDEEMENKRDKYVKSVVTLFKKFLLLLANLNPRDTLLLNPRDGEILDRFKVLEMLALPKEERGSKLKEKEVRAIKRSPGFKEDLKGGRGGRQGDNSPFWMVHPLVVSMKMGYDRMGFMEAQGKMRRVVKQLNMWKRKGEATGDWGDLDKALKLD